MDWDDILESYKSADGNKEPADGNEKPEAQAPADDITPEPATAPSSTSPPAPSPSPPVSPSPPHNSTQPWQYPAPDLSGAPVSSAIKAAYSRIAEIYDAIPYLHPRCSEMRAAYQAALASPEFQAAEAAITAQFHLFQEAVKRTTPGPDHRAKAEAAKNVRAGCKWLGDFVGYRVKVASI